MRTSVLSACGVALAIAVAGCGAMAIKPSQQPQPSSWGTLRLASGASLPYPSSWRLIDGDPGTASAAMLATSGTIRAYLNVTPAENTESFSNWATFRLHHNADEGDRDVRLISTAPPAGLTRRASACVTDQYTTTRTTYRELACIVARGRDQRATVLVAAAQPDLWNRERTAFDFAFRHFTG